MKLFSTNNKNNIVNLREAVLDAYPADRGLYLPCALPKIDQGFYDSLDRYSFPELSFRIANHLLRESIPEEPLSQIVERSMSFPAPLIDLNNHLHVLELFHGPTMAFKDFGARFMAELMSYLNRGEDQLLTILVATSGDTGGAVAAGFYEVPGIEVIILYPSGKVSPLQEKQLTGWGKNIRAVEVNGVFDDCQSMVKQAFLDEQLRSKFRFSSANSINIARLIPQSFYYFEGYKQLGLGSRPTFIVPSGNFGNLTAGVMASHMGLPVNKFVAALNSNTTFLDYLETSEYAPRPSIATLSNAMDVGNPSNFFRLIYLLGSTWNKVKTKVSAFSYNDEQTLNAIRAVYERYGYIADPHGVLGVLTAEKLMEDESAGQYIVLETAHPGKFKDTVDKALQSNFQPPEKLSEFLNSEKQAFPISNSYEDFQSFLLSI